MNPFVDGTYPVLWSSSGATSYWANDKADTPMNVNDFPRPGLGAQGKISDLAMNVLVTFLDPQFINPSMKGLVDHGAGKLAAFNAKCKHLGCTALWRTQAEATNLVPVNLGHDFIVCPCHLGSYDIYDSARVKFGPPPQPLDQLKLEIQPDGAVHIKFVKYKYGKNITGGQV